MRPPGGIAKSCLIFARLPALASMHQCVSQDQMLVSHHFSLWMSSLPPSKSPTPLSVNSTFKISNKVDSDAFICTQYIVSKYLENHSYRWGCIHFYEHIMHLSIYFRVAPKFPHALLGLFHHPFPHQLWIREVIWVKILFEFKWKNLVAYVKLWMQIQDDINDYLLL